MSRLAGILLLLLLAPLAAAQAADGEAAQPQLPDALTSAAAAARASISAAGSAAVSAASDGASAIGRGIAAAATAIGSALQAIGAGIASLASAAATLIATAIASTLAFLGALGLQGAQLARDHPRETAIAATSVAGAGTLAWLAKRFGALLFLPLYTRLAPSEMLDNAARSRVYDHVRAHPGAHPSAIAQTLDLGWGTVIYHLSKLEETQLVVAKSASHRKCYFATGTELNAEARTAVAAMTHDKAKLIVNAVRAAPGISQKDLAERLGMSQALASWHIKRLVTSGVLLTVREGRSNALRVAEHVPVTTPAAPLAAA